MSATGSAVVIGGSIGGADAVQAAPLRIGRLVAAHQNILYLVAAD